MGLLVYTFGAFAYAALLAISVREDGRNNRNATADPNIDRTARVGFALWTVCLLWFAVNLIIGLAELGPHRQIWPVTDGCHVAVFRVPAAHRPYDVG